MYYVYVEYDMYLTIFVRYLVFFNRNKTKNVSQIKKLHDKYIYSR